MTRNIRQWLAILLTTLLLSDAALAAVGCAMMAEQDSAVMAEQAANELPPCHQPDDETTQQAMAEDCCDNCACATTCQPLLNNLAMPELLELTPGGGITLRVPVPHTALKPNLYRPPIA